MTNPYISLMKTAWHFAKKEKRQYVAVYSLFILASGTFALFPLLYGWFINTLQKQEVNHLRYAWLYAGVYMLLKIVEWGFHGPARILERKLAFNLSRNFLQELYHLRPYIYRSNGIRIITAVRPLTGSGRRTRR